MKGIIRKEYREGWNSPVWGICSCSFLGVSWVPYVKVHACSHGSSVWLLIPWGLWFLCKVWEYLYSSFSHVVSGLASVDCHRQACFFWSVTGTDAHVGLLYLVFGFCLGLFHGMALYGFVTSCVCVTHDVCIMLGSSLVFLAFFVMWW